MQIDSKLQEVIPMLGEELRMEGVPVDKASLEFFKRLGLVEEMK